MRNIGLILLFFIPLSTFADLASEAQPEIRKILVSINQPSQKSSYCLEVKPDSLSEHDTIEAPAELQVKCGNVFLSVGGFSEENGDRSGLEISVLINTTKKYASRISGVLYSGRNNEELMDSFTGFSFTGYLHLNQKYLNPYLGLGVFMGDTFNCSDDESEECEEEGIFTIYPEVGLAINAGKLHIFPYVRRYNFNGHNTYGLNLGLKF